MLNRLMGLKQPEKPLSHKLEAISNNLKLEINMNFQEKFKLHLEPAIRHNLIMANI